MTATRKILIGVLLLLLLQGCSIGNYYLFKTPDREISEKELTSYYKDWKVSRDSVQWLIPVFESIAGSDIVGEEADELMRTAMLIQKDLVDVETLVLPFLQKDTGTINGELEWYPYQKYKNPVLKVPVGDVLVVEGKKRYSLLVDYFKGSKMASFIVIDNKKKEYAYVDHLKGINLKKTEKWKKKLANSLKSVMVPADINYDF